MFETTPDSHAPAPLSIVILAAGQGKRMNSDIPKVLQPLAGKPLLQHVLTTAKSLQPAQLLVVYGHGGEQVRKAMKNEPAQWIYQEQQLGTGHAVLQAMPTIPDENTVLVLYGDVPLIRASTLKSLIEAVDTRLLALLTVMLEDPTGYGRIVRDGAGHVREIIEHKDASSDQLLVREGNSGVLAANAGMLREWLQGLRTNNAQGEYYLTDVVGRAAAMGDSVAAIIAPSALEVLGVNDKIQLSQVEAGFRRNCAEQLMRAGATLVDPARIDVRGEVQVGRDVFIDVNAVLLGSVTLGNRVTIGPNCVIRDSSIADGTEVLANSIIEDSLVGSGCRVGPFARLRPHTQLGDRVHVGNFVEIKASTVGAGSKLNHLSYVGDAQVGDAVNVGAGTITCNYDGANKWPTIIEDGAFIGSGSMLVAPLRIGAGATIGAGSTLSANAPAGKLTLTRSKQATASSWRRPEQVSAAEKARKTAQALNPGLSAAIRQLQSSE